MNKVKTKAGTELPLRNLQGKDYLEVAYRVLWMREEHPEWAIQTEFLSLTETVAIAKATILDGSGKIIAQGTKMETQKGFFDFVEKSETGSVGRALALCGYGTQFAQELDEGERIVDAPREKKTVKQSTNPGEYVIKIGKKYQGKKLEDCDVYELNSFSDWLSSQEKLEGLGLETRDAIELFLKSREVESENGKNTIEFN